MLKKIKPILKFSHSFEISVFDAEFKPSTTIHLLDIEKLLIGSHKLEIGQIEGGCCHKIVHAIIKDGIVDRLEVEKCIDAPAYKKSVEIEAVFAIAKQKLAQNRGNWQPIPIKELVAAIVARTFDTIIGTGAGCFFICIWHYCAFCCISTEPNGQPSCWIETRKLDNWL